MKVVITSKGESPECLIDPRFGRCQFFAFYDTETGELDFKHNPNKEADSGAGPASVQFIANEQVERIYSCAFGMKIKSILDDLKIQMVVVKDDLSINDIINKLKK